MCVCKYVSMCVCKYVSMYACMYVSICAAVRMTGFQQINDIQFCYYVKLLTY